MAKTTIASDQSNPPYQVFCLGDQCVTFSLGSAITLSAHRKIMAMKHWLESNPFPGLLDIVVAYNSLTLVYDAYAVQRSVTTSPSAFARERLISAYHHSPEHLQNVPRQHHIPVCYEEPYAVDLEWLAGEKRLEREKIVELHTSRVYQVYMIGFLPGFPYMAELDAKIASPRKNKPVPVLAGSVGIAGIQTGIYPVHSPGGWQIIGRTPLKLFDAHATEPALLEAGDEVQFFSISKREFGDRLMRS